MEVSEAIQKRVTIRKWKSIPVEREKIIRVLESGRRAPSWGNVQPWRFVVLDEPQAIRRFGEAAFSGVYRFSRWVMDSPVIIAIFANLDWIANRIGKQIQGTSYYLIDIGIAGEHVVLQAEEQGLGSCWIGWFDSKKGAKILEAPRNWKLTALLAIGYPAKPIPSGKAKKALDDILFFNKFAG